jgi:mono/diheme cytochrome c family protein
VSSPYILRNALAALALLLVVASGAHADDAIVAKGEYLVRAADCASCHTVPGGHLFAGGRAFTLPGMGTLYSPNITPDPKTGIGGYSDDDWVSMLHKGVGRGGKHLYPAMPYASYTKLSRDDALAIKAYLFTLKPVENTQPANKMKFPFDQRWGMMAWNVVNASDRRFEPDAAKPAAWNRGAYLVEALGHCGECHTPRNFTQGLSSKAYAGAKQQGWLAYNISSDKNAGIGSWTDAQLAEYLSTGKAPGRGPASGPMAEVIEYSLRYLTKDDIAAMVVYLRDRPAQPDGPPAVPGPITAAAAPDPMGAHLYNQACAGCHLPSGAGRQSPWAALGGAHTTGDITGTNLVQVLAHGTQIETDQGLMFMHSFTGGYTDQELSVIANYTIGQMSGRQGQVTPQQIREARGADEHKPTDPPPQVVGVR